MGPGGSLESGQDKLGPLPGDGVCVCVCVCVLELSEATEVYSSGVGGWRRRALEACLFICGSPRPLMGLQMAQCVCEEMSGGGTTQSNLCVCVCVCVCIR